MQVSIESVGLLGRRMTVWIGFQDLEPKISERLKNMAKKIKLDGFRPGKVPLTLVEKRYKAAVRNEVIGEEIESTLKESIKTENFRLANKPNVEITKDDMLQGVEYVATFEVYPEISTLNLDGIKLQKYVPVFSEEDIDNVIQRWRQDKATWVSVERAAVIGDRVLIDFESKINGELVKSGSAKDAEVILGSQTMVEGFETGLVGLSATQGKELELDISAAHRDASIAGQKTQITVTLKKVSEPALPAIDEEFCKAYGIADGGMDKLRAKIKEGLAKEADKLIKEKLKAQLFSQLIERNHIEVPESLVKNELAAIQQRIDHHEHDDTCEHSHDNIEENSILYVQAANNVKIGIIFGHFVNEHHLAIDSLRVKEAIQNIAQGYRGDKEKILNFIQRDQNTASRIMASVLEEQAFDKMLDLVVLEEKLIPYKDLVDAL